MAYALDPLDEAQAAPIREHLEACPTCRAIVKRVRAVRELLRVSESHRPSPEALARAKAVFGRQQLGWREQLGQVLTGPEWYQSRRSLALLLLMLAFAAAGARTIVDQSRAALPGDRLYAVRRLAEKVALATMYSDVGQAQMHVTLIGTRVNDLVALATAGRYEDIPPSVNDFRAEIDDTVVSFRSVAKYDQANGIVFVQQAEQSLNEGAQSLSTLALAGPPGALPIMRSAVEAAVAGKKVVRAQLPVAARTALDLTAPQPTLPPVAVTALADSTWSATLAISATQTLTRTATGTASSSPTAGTPTQTATPRPSPTASDTGAPTPTNEATRPPAPGASATASGTPRFTPSPTPTLTPMPSATPTPRPTATDTPVPTDTNTPLPTPTDTPRPTETDTPVPTDTNTPLPTATPVPSDTPVPTDTPIPTNVPPPTNTAVPLTNTDVPPTNTDVPPPTNTDVPPPTNTAVPPLTNTAVPALTNTAERAREASPTNNNAGGRGGGGLWGLLA